MQRTTAEPPLETPFVYNKLYKLTPKESVFNFNMGLIQVEIFLLAYENKFFEDFEWMLHQIIADGFGNIFFISVTPSSRGNCTSFRFILYTARIHWQTLLRPPVISTSVVDTLPREEWTVDTWFGQSCWKRHTRNIRMYIYRIYTVHASELELGCISTVTHLSFSPLFLESVLIFFQGKVSTSGVSPNTATMLYVDGPKEHV